MAVTYKKLWHLLINHNLIKKDLEEMPGITNYQTCKLEKDKDVTTDMFGAVCEALCVHVDT
jgi:putative transcriptional regulator